MHDEDRSPAGRPSVPAMLSISEILVCIFNQLDCPSCAAVARVCRTWVDVALDVLWEDLESLFPIMGLLGPIELYGRRFEGYGNKWVWQTGSPDGDWARFVSYMKRVRSFSNQGQPYTYRGISVNQPGPDVLAKLFQYVGNHATNLLPQCQRLRWRAGTDYDLQAISHFLSPTLREVDIDLEWNVYPSAQLFRTLHALLSRDMASFRFVPIKAIGEVETELTSFINNRETLRVLRVPAGPMNSGMFISSLLVLEAECGSAWKADPGAFLLHIPDNCPLIQDVRIIFPNDSMFTVESIRPLLRCSQLRSLDLEYPGAVAIRDDQVREMGRAWRELEALHVASRRASVSPVERPYGAPIASLVTFAQAFSPKLRKLAIPLNTYDVPFPPDPPIRFASLELFSVGTSQLSSSEAEHRRIVRFLNAVLPVWINSIHSEDSLYHPSRSIFNLKTLEDGRLSAIAGWDMLSEMLSDYRKASSDDA